MLSPNISMIAPVVIVKAPVASIRSIKLESEPAKKPDAIMSYNGIFTNENHIKFHITIVNNTQAHDALISSGSGKPRGTTNTRKS